MLPVDPDRQAALRCLYEVYRVPVELILRVTHYSPLTVERWIKVDEWVSMNSVDTLNQRFIDVLQSCLDELGAPQTEANTTVSDARIRLLQNLAKALETAVTVDTRLRDAKGKGEGRDGPDQPHMSVQGEC